MSSHFDVEFERVVLIEGGYSDNPADSGGRTRYGITERVARANGYTGPMSALDLATARAIYRTQYWGHMRLDDIAQLSPRIAGELFDTGVNAGTGAAIRMLQRLLNVLNLRGSMYADQTVDGAAGPITIAALGEYLKHRGGEGEWVLFVALNSLQGEHYVSLAERREKDEAFVYGQLRARVSGHLAKGRS